MPPLEKNDYAALLERARELIRQGQARSVQELAELLGVDRNTMMGAFRRNFGIKTFREINARGAPGKPLVGNEAEDTLEVEIDGNSAVIRSVQVLDQIKTIPQLLKHAGIDPADWVVHNPKIKKWDVAIKLKQSKDHETLQVVPSIYIEAPLRAKHPQPFEPVIQPIQFMFPSATKHKKTRDKNKGGIQRALIVNDPQVGFRRRLHTSDLTPFHDRRVLDIALQIAQAEKIDHISFGGDCLDLSEWSNKFTPEPEFYWTTQPALIEWAWWLAQFRAAQPSAEMRMLEGNHDARLPNLIVSNMRQAYKLKPVDELELPPSLSLPRLLALHQLDVEYASNYPDNGYWLNENVCITHGDVVRAGPGDTAKAIAQKTAYTTVFGHIHRRESVTRRLKSNGGDMINTAFCPGCACHTDGRVPGSKSDQQWQQGIAVIEYTPTAEHIIPIAISGGEAIYNGRAWKAREQAGEIEKIITESLEKIM